MVDHLINQSKPQLNFPGIHNQRVLWNDLMVYFFILSERKKWESDKDGFIPLDPLGQEDLIKKNKKNKEKETVFPENLEDSIPLVN